MAINSYTISVFAPLNTLGGVYNGIVQAWADLSLLMDLLQLEPGVQDREDAMPIPIRPLMYPSAALTDSRGDVVRDHSKSPWNDASGGGGVSVEFEGKLLKWSITCNCTIQCDIY